MSLMLYFFWSGISLTIFYGFYKSVLQKETFFLVNRIYLLFSMCFSVLIPFLDLTPFVTLPKIELMASTLSLIPDGGSTMGGRSEANPLAVIYWIGVLLAAILLVIKISGIKGELKSVEKGNAFSFWKTKVIDADIANFDIIDAHENIHIKQFHTLDILVVEIVKVFLWFNPVVYYYGKSLRWIHEFLADEHAAKLAGSKKRYAMALFLKNFNAGPALANTFFNDDLLEGRIMMLQRERSGAYRLWKYALTLPMVLLLVLFCSFGNPGFTSPAEIHLDKAAHFPGGFEAFSKYLMHTAQNVSDKKGRVKLSFIVETSGLISHVKVEHSLDRPSDSEAIRMISESPKWEPAILDGKPVRSSYQMGINFMGK